MKGWKDVDFLMESVLYPVNAPHAVIKIQQED